MTEQETAEALHIAVRTVRRDWIKARGLLYQALGDCADVTPPAPRRAQRATDDDARGSSRERWDVLEPLLDAALELEPAERGAFLDEACRDDAALRTEVSALLAACEPADRRFSQSRPRVAYAPLLAEPTRRCRACWADDIASCARSAAAGWRPCTSPTIRSTDDKSR